MHRISKVVLGSCLFAFLFGCATTTSLEVRPYVLQYPETEKALMMAILFDTSARSSVDLSKEARIRGGSVKVFEIKDGNVAIVRTTPAEHDRIAEQLANLRAELQRRDAKPCATAGASSSTE